LYALFQIKQYGKGTLIPYVLKQSFFHNQKPTTMTGYHTYKSCIEACLKCAAICNHCASSCTQEEDVKMMSKCIQLDMECAAICYASAQLMSLGSDKAKEICRLCADICEACGNECAKHSHSKHCQECADACKACAEECRKMAA
jgi:hypothetical protein